jgi:uncharacterized protein
MHPAPSGLRLSASDLSNHLACRHLTQLERSVAEGLRKKPEFYDPALKGLQDRGYEHERQYVEHLKAQGLNVVVLPDDGNESGPTLEAMRKGAEVIVQGVFASDHWFGRADILRRVPTESKLGAWSYEAYDTKLSKETRGSAVLQLCLYSELLEGVQGILPEHLHVVPPGNGFKPDTHRVLDYLAYYRWVKANLEGAVAAPLKYGSANPGTYPEPVERCDYCNWRKECEAQRRTDDHLSLVAGISRSQRRELVDREVPTLASLGRLPLPIPFKPERGSKEALEKVREQAAIQLAGREQGKHLHQLLPPEPARGLALLPEPDAGDIFFDFEGDPFVTEGGLEYLFGYSSVAGGREQYEALWALNRAEEKVAFETFVDRLMARWAKHPGMHVYHYAPYEPTALKRLMGRHRSREEEVDRMLRAGLFVDLYQVVRQGLRASVESYSIKKLEPFFKYVRKVELPEVGAHKRALEAALEAGVPEQIDAEDRRVVQGYNEDDCLAAFELRNWLEELRAEQIAKGVAIPRPTREEKAPSEKHQKEREEARALRERLLASVPTDPATRSWPQTATALLAELLDFHWREEKVAWWERYRLYDLADDDLLEEREGLAGLTFVENLPLPPKDRTPLHRYAFLAQDTDIKAGDEVFVPQGAEKGHKLGTVEAIDLGARTIDIKKMGKTAKEHPPAIFAHKVIGAPEMAASLFRVGTHIAEQGIEPGDAHRAARDLLLRLPPRLRAGTSIDKVTKGAKDSTDAACGLVLAAESGLLAIQGPPGAGKTYAAAKMILALVDAGKKVGITAVGHATIGNVFKKVLELAPRQTVKVRCGHKGKKGEEPFPGVEPYDDNDDALAALSSGAVNVLGGTAWLWSREEAAGAVDVLFVDEAGQLSLASALAVAQAAKTVVLLGDPRQLEQPKKGSHPDGAEISALEYVLDGHPTMPEGRGLFLGETWRLHPEVCAFTSELFYEGRLSPRPGLERQAVKTAGLPKPAGAGLWLLPVEHEGNQSASPEEVAAVDGLVAKLLAPGATWTDDEGATRPLTPEDILVVAPYNAQVSALKRRLPKDCAIGTVDKFQGQEAPVVIVSMTSSSAEDAPRGMEFLYSLNRLNVATSRAQAACILVASPRLFEPECKTPRQMKLANALCRYRELANVL